MLKARGYDVKSNVAYLAGHSLGEYAALTAAGAGGRLRAFAEIARQAMQRACRSGAMAALLGLDFETVVEVAAEATAENEFAARPMTMRSGRW